MPFKYFSKNHFLLKSISFLLLTLFIMNTSAQDLQLTGRVLDSETKEPLPFVNIVYTEKGTGTTTNLNGYFTIPVSDKLSTLRFSYVGYELKSVSVHGIDLSLPLVAELQKKSFEIEELTIYPGVNPAHRIIKLALENRDMNNPEKMRSFSYQSYNKMVFTFEKDTALSSISEKVKKDSLLVEKEEFLVDSVQKTKIDSSNLKLQKFLEKQDIFIMESVSKRDYLYPGKNNEVVLASRVSGFHEPSFVMLATQLQSFSFYNELITISNRRYLNPISSGSAAKYSFILEDSMLTAKNDTLFIISFRPYKNKNFDGLKGVLSINSRGFAIQSVITEPAEKGKFFNMRIQQNYELIDNRQWFPVELNTEIYFPNIRANNTHYVIGKGRSYLSEIRLTPELPRKNFGHVELRIDSKAHLQTDDYWGKYRAEPLSEKNLNTYQIIDSLGKANKLDRTLQILETLASGYIPAGFFNIDYNSLLDYNKQEGFRAGIHLKTNQRVSERFSLGGRFAYGFKDEKIKYGGYGELLIYRPNKLTLGLYHSKDVKESGSYSFYNPVRFFSTEQNRRVVLQNLDYVWENEMRLKFHGLQYLSGEIFLSKSDHTVPGNYQFLVNGELLNEFTFVETGFRFRYAHNEKFFQTPKGEKISLGTKAPILFLNITKGLDSYSGNFSYIKTEVRFTKSFTRPKTGTTTLTIEGGSVFGEVPASKLYFGKGSYDSFSLEAENSFGAMRTNEFLNKDFVNIFFRHNFHSLLFKTKKIRPHIIAITNFAIGRSGSQLNHLNMDYSTMEKGYFESGLLFNNLINQLFFGYGVGVYYRYGAYSFNKTIDNFAFKLSLSVNL